MSHQSRRLATALSSGLLLRGVGAIVNVASVPIALRTLGQERYAAFAAVLGLAGWLTIGSFGLGNVTAMSIAGLHQDEEASRQLFWQVVVSSCIIVLVVSIAAYIPFELMSGRLLGSSPSGVTGELRYAGWYCFAAFAVCAAATPFEGRYVGLLRIDYCNWVRITGQLVALASLMLVARYFDSMLALCVAVTIGQVGSALWFMAKGFIEFRPATRFVYDRRLSLSLVRQGGGFLASSLAVLFYGGGSLPLLAVTFGTGQLATAAVMSRLVQMYFSVVSILLHPLATALRQALVVSDAGWIRAALRRSAGALLGVAAIAGCGLVGVGAPAITRWTGTDLPLLSEWLLPVALLLAAISWSYLWVYACFATRGPELVAGLATAEVTTIAVLYYLVGSHIRPASSLYIAAVTMLLMSGTVLPVVVLRDDRLRLVEANDNQRVLVPSP